MKSANNDTSNYIHLCPECRQFYNLEDEKQYEERKQILFCFHAYCEMVDKFKK